MMRALIGSALAFALACAIGCNQQSACPAKDAIQPGAACSDEQLQCAYDLATPSAACDGTSTTLATSCICTSGAWACPSAFTCEAGPPSQDEAGADAADDGGAVGDADAADGE